MGDLVSVLMCVYNTPVDYLKEAIDSILNQSYQNFEFIIVDDCSTDSEVISCLEFYKNADDRVIIINNKTNTGLTKALNIGIFYCKGTYIARMDSDDISLGNRLQSQVDYLKSHGDVALVGSNIICFGNGVEEIDTSKLESSSDDYDMYLIHSLIQHSGPPHPTFMFRADFLRQNSIKYREDILKAQDYGIMADILKAGGVIKKIHEPLLRYRVHDKQITSTSEIEQKIYQLRVSFDLLRVVFPALSDAECLAISLLGCPNSPEEISEVMYKNRSIAQVMQVYSENQRALNEPGTYITALKKTFKHNAQGKTYNPAKLEAELRYRWWKYALHRTKVLRRLWGMRAYTILSYRYNWGHRKKN